MCSIQTTQALFDALGGTAAVRELVAAERQITVQGVHAWKQRGQLSGWSYLIIKQALAARGLPANPKLWGIAEPSEAAE